jgi:ubiquinone biosynthesis protein
VTAVADQPLTVAGTRDPGPGTWPLLGRAAVLGAITATGVARGAAAVLVVAVTRGRTAARTRVATELVRLIDRLGPTFIKVAQVLGTRRDVVPGWLCDELADLQDSVPALSPRRGRAALLAVYGEQLNELFGSIELEPVASGSIACVYRGTLRDETAVALKLQRPGIGPRMAADLKLLRHGARVLARLPMLRGVPVREVVQSLCDVVVGQLDFGLEAANLARLRNDLAVMSRVRVPRVRPELSRPECIVMDFIDGLAVDTGDRCSPAMRRTFAAQTLGVVYQMLFINGFVHCDLHPGNLYFTTAGHVVVLDAGFSAQLSPRMKRLFAEFFLNMSIGRGERCAAIVVRSAIGVRGGADLEAFNAGVTDLVERNHRAPARDFSLIAFAAELFDLQRRYGVAASPELIFPLLSLLVVEGTVRHLDPGIDFQDAAKPTLNRALFGVK